MTDTRVTQGAAEILVSPTPPFARVTQAAAEVLYPVAVPTSARVTQGAVEVMAAYTKTRLTQAVVEVMHSGVPQGRWVPFNTIL